MEKQTITVYHGTTSKNVPAIEAKGLEPAKHAGADEWAQRNGLHVDTAGVERPPSVYVTRNWANAVYFARLTARAFGGAPRILELQIPKDKFKAEFVPDEGSVPHSDNWRVASAIPPAWIVDAKPVPRSTHIVEL